MKAQRGFSLVELMIAVTLGLFLSGAAISAFVSMKRVQSSTSGVATLSDSGRFAMEGLGQGVRSAGYLVCTPTSNARVDLPTSLGAVVSDLGEPLGGYEFNGSGPGTTVSLSWPSTPSSDPTTWLTSTQLGNALDPKVYNAAVSGTLGRVLPGSDVLAVHETPVGVVPVYLSADAAAGVGTLTTTLSVTTGNTGFAKVIAAGGTPVSVVSNCQSAEIEASSVSGANLNFSPINAQATLTTSYGAGAHVGLVTTRVYYIGLGEDGEGALFMLDTGGSTVFATPVELVPDVENMQILYGIDTTGSQTVGEYVTGDQVATKGTSGDFNSVIDVKIGLLVAGPLGSSAKPSAQPTFNLLGTTVKAPVDTRMRRVFTSTIALRNFAG
jgi:type IV pilus assembly protein PilW